MLMAHRGGKAEWPENTLLAIENCKKLGIRAIEIDVHLSLDNELVVIHDESVDRTTNSKGMVKELSLNQLKSLDAGGGEQIPTLKEVLSLLSDGNILLQIEIKAKGTLQILTQLIQEYKAYDWVRVICFDHFELLDIKNIDKNIKTAGLIYGLPVDCVSVANSAKLDGLSFNTKLLNQKTVDDLKKNNLSVTCWNVVSKKEYEYFKNMGIDIIATDYPTKLF